MKTPSFISKLEIQLAVLKICSRQKNINKKTTKTLIIKNMTLSCVHHRLTDAITGLCDNQLLTKTVISKPKIKNPHYHYQITQKGNEALEIYQNLSKILGTEINGVKTYGF